MCIGHQDSQAGLGAPATLEPLNGSADDLVLFAAWAAWALACQYGQCDERWSLLP